MVLLRLVGVRDDVAVCHAVAAEALERIFILGTWDVCLDVVKRPAGGVVLAIFDLFVGPRVVKVVR